MLSNFRAATQRANIFGQIVLIMTRTRDYCLSIRIVEIVRSRTWSRVYSIIVNATTLFKHDRVSKLGLHLV